MDRAPDNRIVLTLDVGGTDLAFSAVQAGRHIVPAFAVPAPAATVEDFLHNLVQGFRRVMRHLAEAPAAISSSFPGPADYERGVIGDLVNLPVFRGGVPVGPMLQQEFGIPVFLNNDGDLFALGEARAGLLPHVNGLLQAAGSGRCYRNLLGVTLGTGFGCGIVHGQGLLRGDNSAAAEINRMRNRLLPEYSVEESVSARGVRRVYARESGLPPEAAPDPKAIFEIGMGQRPGNRAAARAAFTELAVVAGDALANAVTLIDGLVVLGGGLAGAGALFQQRLVEEMNSPLRGPQGHPLPRMESRAYNLDSEEQLREFLRGSPGTERTPSPPVTLTYQLDKRVGVARTRLGTQAAISLGAYHFALTRLGRTAPG